MGTAKYGEVSVDWHSMKSLNQTDFRNNPISSSGQQIWFQQLSLVISSLILVSDHTLSRAIETQLIFRDIISGRIGIEDIYSLCSSC